MKSIQILLICILFAGISYAQTYSDGWAVGAGFTSPRMFGDVYSEALDFGGHFFIQRDLDEINSLRLQVDYLMFTSSRGLDASNPSTDAAMVGLDYLIGLRVCNPVKLYAGFGGKVISYTVKKAILPVKSKTMPPEIAASFYAGAKYSIDSDFDLKAEISYNQVSTDRFDGKYGPSGGLFGGTLDAYCTSSFSLMYYIDRGEKTHYCDASGLSQSPKPVAKEGVTIEQIEEVVKKYAVKSVDKPMEKAADIDYNRMEDILKKYAVQPSQQGSTNWVLVGINFDEGKATFRPEAYPILLNAVQALLSQPEMRIEIQGHTDNVGNEEMNKKLSQARAETVARYLIAKGISASRLTPVGYGASRPAADNKTAEGRELNRRIEFKVIQ